ncbi:hypothetical protein TNCV_5084561 [Trichonephila clavipes]|uniref:Uncharacterized protein n=1 Tax=Trichonephila clavipes TaxID=2585209 RepID=A0A8X6VH89_TRICX|nr:hypothetical protein TNCV_5084561 [Trichonephila clavipes]
MPIDSSVDDGDADRGWPKGEKVTQLRESSVNVSVMFDKTGKTRDLLFFLGSFLLFRLRAAVDDDSMSYLQLQSCKAESGEIVLGIKIRFFSIHFKPKIWLKNPL